MKLSTLFLTPFCRHALLKMLSSAVSKCRSEFWWDCKYNEFPL